MKVKDTLRAKDSTCDEDESLLTLSFYVKSDEVVKLYLYRHGQLLRFMPEDIRTVLPKLFNMNYGKKINQQFLKSKNVDEHIDRMKGLLKDVEFEAFQQSYM